MTGARPAALFLSPIMPRQSGNGLAMRAAMILQGLARRFDIYLLVIPVSGGSHDIPDFVRHATVETMVAPGSDIIDPLAALIAQTAEPERAARLLAYPRPWSARFSGVAAARLALAFTAGIRLELIHVMRLYLAPIGLYALRLLHPAVPKHVVDLDDDDVRVQRRLGNAAASKYETILADTLPHCALALTSSHDDADRLACQHQTSQFRAVPNGYAALPRPPRSPRTQTIRLIFVANFTYAPNADAARFLLDEIFPVLGTPDCAIRVDMVGAGLPQELGRPGVYLHGRVDDLAGYYADADIAIVPLRIGGGTRIKILEAFAHGVPVVSTAIGAEGLDANHGEHLLCADDPHAFAAACLALATDPALARRLSDNAHALLHRRYTPRARPRRARRRPRHHLHERYGASLT